MRLPILSHRPSTVRSAAALSSAFSLAKAFSIGLKSGQGGRKSRLAPAASMACQPVLPARSRSPSGARPWRRATLVDAQVSSMKVRRSDRVRFGRRTSPGAALRCPACPARPRAPPFFARDAAPLEGAPERADAAPRPFSASRPVARQGLCPASHRPARESARHGPRCDPTGDPRLPAPPGIPADRTRCAYHEAALAMHAGPLHQHAD